MDNISQDSSIFHTAATINTTPDFTSESAVGGVQSVMSSISFEDSAAEHCSPEFEVTPGIPIPQEVRVSTSSGSTLFNTRRGDAGVALEISTGPSESLSSDRDLPPTPPTLTPDRLDTPSSSSSASTLFGEESDRDFEGPFFFKPVIKRPASEEITKEKLALKKALKLQIPISADHSLSHKRNAPDALPLMQATPAHRRQRRRSLPSSPFILMSALEDLTIEHSESPAADLAETPDHLLYSGLQSALQTQRMLDTPYEPFPETPDSALFEPIEISMIESPDDDEGYISDPGSAITRYFAAPERQGPKIQRGKQLPFPIRPTKAVPVSLLQAGSNPIAVKESKHARMATLKRRYHNVPAHYGPESPLRSPIAVRSPLRSPNVLSPNVIPFGRRPSIFDSSKVGMSSPLAQRPMQSLA